MMASRELSPLEQALEERVQKQAKKHGYTVYKVQFIGTRAAPDRVFGRNGRAVFIEFKRLDKEPTAQQVKRHKELCEAFGWDVRWTDDYFQACEILEIPPHG